MSKSLNLKWAIMGLVGFAILIWIVVLAFKDIPLTDSWEAIKEIPTVIGWMAPIGYLFMNWGWRCRIFKKWLILIPDLNGTWEGEIRSEWIDPSTEKQILPEKAFLVIRQTLFDIHCCHMTEESKSYSRAAVIQIIPNGQLLEFTYSNSPRVSVQHKSNAHDGACSMDIIDSPHRKLVGKYWTERPTKGELEFKFTSKKLKQEFS